MKWVICPGCDKWKLLSRRARSCSCRCRNRVWRRAHGVMPRRLENCAWCGAPLLYMPQDRLPGCRRYCHAGSAHQARLVRRAQRSMTNARAIQMAIERLHKSRQPRHRAAAAALVELQRELLPSEPKIADFPTRSAATAMASA
jgi:hypothetical protein